VVLRLTYHAHLKELRSTVGFLHQRVVYLVLDLRYNHHELMFITERKVLNFYRSQPKFALR